MIDEVCWIRTKAEIAPSEVTLLHVPLNSWTVSINKGNNCEIEIVSDEERNANSIQKLLRSPRLQPHGTRAFRMLQYEYICLQST